MTRVVGRPAMLTGGLALVMWVAAAAVALWMGLASPRPTWLSVPWLLADVPSLLVAAGMLWSSRSRRPYGLAATLLWWLTFVVVVASTPRISIPLAERLPEWTGLTDQNGPSWNMWPVTGLVAVALLSQVPGRPAARPAMTVAGLSAVLAVVLSFGSFILRVAGVGNLSWYATPLSYVIALTAPLLVGLAMVGCSLARRATVPAGVGRVPSRSQRVTIAVLLLAAGFAKAGAQLVRWHTCLGWSWSAGEEGCGTVQSHGHDFAFPSLSAVVPGASVSHGVGLALLALALALASRFGPAGAPVRTALTRVLWAFMVAVLVMDAAVTLAPALRFVEESDWASLAWALMDPLVFAVLAVLAGFDRRGDTTGRTAQRWNVPLTQLLVGMALTTFLIEFVFWSGIYASYDTPPGSGTLRALVLIGVGVRLLRRGYLHGPPVPHTVGPLRTSGHEGGR